MSRTVEQLRQDSLSIWQAGLNAVRADRLVENAVRVTGGTLTVGGQSCHLSQIGRIAIVGAGKAGAAMAAGLENSLGDQLLDQKQVTGWINVPADCMRRLKKITLHPARPAGVNEPTGAGAAGANEILQIVEGLGPKDVCFVLISGGGSALLPAPAAGISLADKLAVTQFLSAAGANINELNTVRKQLSRIKGGGLARACRAGQLFALVISDVLGDPLDIIASGPTVLDRSTPHDALTVLDRFDAHSALPKSIFTYLERELLLPPAEPTCQIANLVIGNNALAVDAAKEEAQRLGYHPSAFSADKSEGGAEQIGQHLATQAAEMLQKAGPDCLISGGEPVVRLAPPERRGKGGRNQQLVLAATEWLMREGDARGILLLSGGTDGEDGPTDAAGAWVDGEIIAQARKLGLDPADYLARNDAYHFFEPLGALIKTGPTHTNVCDLRVVLAAR